MNYREFEGLGPAQPGRLRARVDAIAPTPTGVMASVEFDDLIRGKIVHTAAGVSDVAAVFECVRTFVAVTAELEDINAWSLPAKLVNGGHRRFCVTTSVLIGAVSHPGYADADTMLTACASAFVDALERARVIDAKPARL